MNAPAPRPFSFTRFLLITLLVLAVIAGLYAAVVWNWSYSSGERAGWVQKFSRKGWLCKTWEGEIALVSMPGAIPEKFNFTVLDDEVAAQINRYMGRRVTLHYEQKIGIPTTCFGETRYYVTRVAAVEEVPIAPGVVAPVPREPGKPGEAPVAPTVPAPVAPALPAPASAPAPAPAPTAPAAPAGAAAPVPPATGPGAVPSSKP
jgi:hypothetical protein